VPEEGVGILEVVRIVRAVVRSGAERYVVVERVATGRSHFWRHLHSDGAVTSKRLRDRVIPSLHQPRI
jgi:hypothetical protein